MNKSELIDTISSEADISKAAAERALTSAMNAIMKAVAEGDRVTLVGFGTFHASKRASRTGLNPRTGEKIEIAAANVPKFTPGAAFKDAANKAQYSAGPWSGSCPARRGISRGLVRRPLFHGRRPTPPGASLKGLAAGPAAPAG